MSKIDRVIKSIERMIDSGALRPGSRLPSIRAAAEEFGVAKNTIVEAYGRLAALQIIQSRPGAGFFVVESAGTPGPDIHSVTEASDIVSLLRAQLTQDYVIRPGDGRPPPSWMRGALPKRVDTQLLAGPENDQTGYGSPLGYTKLREHISRRFTAHGPAVLPPQIVTTFGANHALDLIIRRYLSPGQTVLVDDPGYYPLFAKLHLAQIRTVGVPRRAGGPDLHVLEELAAKHNPVFFFTQSTAHNPTGTSFNLPTAHATLQIASQYNFRVVDDDPFVDLHGRGVAGTRLWELDGFRTVIFVGTYSKILSASFRSGYVIADQGTCDELLEFKMITTVNSSRLSEMLISQMIESRRFDKHLRQLGRQLVEAQEICRNAFCDLGLEMFTNDPNGLYTMLKMPPGASMDRLRSLAAKQHVFLAPGQWFSPSDEGPDHSLRVNFTRSADQRFFSFLGGFLGGHVG